MSKPQLPKTFWLLPACLFVIIETGFTWPKAKKGTDEWKPARSAVRSITAEDAQTHIEILASNDFQGRKSGTSGLKLAANYLAEEFSKFGLRPAAEDKGYYQKFRIANVEIGAASLAIKKKDRKDAIEFAPKLDFVPFSFSGANRVNAPVVFAGYGITAPEYDYDDYDGIDVAGKIVLVLRHEPLEHKRTSTFRGKRLTRHAYFRQKAKNARAHGAAGMLLVTDPLGAHESNDPEGTWPTRYPGRTLGSPWTLLADNALQDFPAIWVGPDVAEHLLAAADHELANLQSSIDRTLKPNSFEIPDLVALFDVELEQSIRETQNVLGFIEGGHPELKAEVVVVGAHYDHLGEANGHVFNGADDNASGTAGLLEIAEAFCLSDVKAQRTLLFVAFAAEEMGLLGSEYYVANPAYPIDDTIFMLNLDMIGRNEPNQVTVVGSNRSRQVHEANLQANREIGFSFQYNGEKYFNRSDHAHFARHRVPILFYNTEVHQDYHRSSDTAEKINFQKVARISRLAFLVSWQIANAPSRPSFERFRLHSE